MDVKLNFHLKKIDPCSFNLVGLARKRLHELKGWIDDLEADGGLNILKIRIEQYKNEHSFWENTIIC